MTEQSKQARALVADTEVLDAQHGGKAVLRGGLGDAEVRPAVREVVEAELVDDRDDAPVPVDPPELPKTLYGTVLAVRDADKRPIIPAWARNQAEAQALATWLAKYGAHVTLYHLTRLPKYGAKLALRAPMGVLVVAVALWAWVYDQEAAPLRKAAAEKLDTADYLKLDKARAVKVHTRAVARPRRRRRRGRAGPGVPGVAPWGLPDDAPAAGPAAPGGPSSASGVWSSGCWARSAPPRTSG